MYDDPLNEIRRQVRVLQWLVGPARPVTGVL